MKDIHVSRETLDKCIEKMFEHNDIIEKWKRAKKDKLTIIGDFNGGKTSKENNITLSWDNA